MDEALREIVALLSVIGVGLTLGKFSWRGVSLGSSGVVFVALAAGHFGFQVPRLAGVAGIILFVYCLGIGAGPGFLRMFFQQGKALAVMAAGMIAAAGIAAWLLAQVAGLEPGLASGLLAGALTSTPALAAATDQLPESTEVAVGFGIAYPFGVIGVILFIQLIPRLMSDPNETADAAAPEDDGPIKRVLVQVANPSVRGRRLADLATLAHANCQISRLMVEGKLQPIPSAFTLELGQRILVVGREKRLTDVIEVLGEKCADADYVLDIERQRRRVVVTSADIVGRSLADLHLRSRFGVTISRIMRHDIEFVPGAGERVQFGDALTAVGEEAGLEKFVVFAGHRERTADESDLISLSLGLLLGILLGEVEMRLGQRSVSLGLAGGPLLIGLLLGHFGHVGPLAGRIPRAGRLLLSELGLALFLAQAGSQAGGNFVSVLQAHGLMLPLTAIVIVITPMVTGLLIAKYFLRLSVLQTSGGICGAMTSTPGLGAVTSTTDSSVPATSYATVYPLALILITILAPLLISQLK
ncbi:MAG: hypothetical protein KDA89_11140 [Planctomycetaceae bacterium]|nr:hypothetical protein [Planctomycetaceae bacterium]